MADLGNSDGRVSTPRLIGICKGFDPGLMYIKCATNGSSCSLLGTQICQEELGCLSKCHSISLDMTKSVLGCF